MHDSQRAFWVAGERSTCTVEPIQSARPTCTGGTIFQSVSQKIAYLYLERSELDGVAQSSLVFGHPRMFAQTKDLNFNSSLRAELSTEGEVALRMLRTSVGWLPQVTQRTSHLDPEQTGKVEELYVTDTNVALRREDGSLGIFGSATTGLYGTSNTDFRRKIVVVPVPAPLKLFGMSESIAIGVTNTGVMYGWGMNAFGALGKITQRIITPITKLFSDVVAIAVGGHHILFQDEEGTIWARGANHHGQLGQNHREVVNIAVKVQIPNEKIVQFAAGSHHSVFRTESGNAYLCGYEKGYARYRQAGIFRVRLPSKVLDIQVSKSYTTYTLRDCVMQHGTKFSGIVGVRDQILQIPSNQVQFKVNRKG